MDEKFTQFKELNTLEQCVADIAAALQTHYGLDATTAETMALSMMSGKINLSKTDKIKLEINSRKNKIRKTLSRIRNAKHLKAWVSCIGVIVGIGSAVTAYVMYPEAPYPRSGVVSNNFRFNMRLNHQESYGRCIPESAICISDYSAAAFNENLATIAEINDGQVELETKDSIIKVKHKRGFFYFTESAKNNTTENIE